MIPAGEIPDFLWFCCGVEIFIINKIKPHAGFCCGFSDHLLLEKNINIVYHRLFYFCPFLFTSRFLTIVFSFVLFQHITSCLIYHPSSPSISFLTPSPMQQCLLAALVLLLGTCLGQQHLSKSEGYQCPSYKAVAQRSTSNFRLADLEGVWYAIATNEPTIPSFCGCTTLNFTMLNVDQKGRAWYQYTATTKCPGSTTFSATMKGWSNSSSEDESGFLHENAALFNRTILPLLPNMVLESTADSVTTYACIGTPLHLFGFTKIVRNSVGYTTERIEREVAALNKSTHGLLDMKKMRVTNASAFKKCGLL